MLLGEPPPTQFDLNFRVLGFPVRVHPFFWLAALILGSNGSGNTDDAGLVLLIWIVSLFVSILIHEMGHSLMMQRFGISSHIVLHMMGGLAIPDSFGFGTRSRDSRSSILISFAGPAAGFLFAAAIVLAIIATGGRFRFDQTFPFYRFALNVVPGPEINPWEYLVHALLYINIFWGLVNLLPVYPLDGGQIARTIMIDQDPARGAINSLWLSVFAGGGMALIGYVTLGSFFVAIMFGMLAVQSYLAIQQMMGGGGGFGGGRPW